MTGCPRWAWCGAALAVVVPGLVLAVTVVAPAAVLVVGLVGATAGHGWRKASKPWPVWLGSCPLLVATGSVATVGWLAAGAPAVLLVVAALGCSAPSVRYRPPSRRYVVAAPPLPAATGRWHPEEDVDAMTDQQLCVVWRSSYDHVVGGRDWPGLAALADTRGACLDELERRHPAGFAAWIDSGARAAGDPEPYLRARR